MKKFILIMLIFLVSCQAEEDLYTVTRVVDGDTFVIDTGEKVRMILINTPESVHWDEDKNTPFGDLASEYSKELLEGVKVSLEIDVSDTDQYGRLLRYVYLEDGTFVNELLVKEGYAQVASYPPDIKYLDIIQAAETHARENNQGLWSNDYMYVGSKNSDIYHSLDCEHVESIKTKNLRYYNAEDIENLKACKACKP